ncbi:nucleotidyltransferase family protein [Ferrovibrio sp.]|uniref:nucleotidyltransferase family protein n=1 Tax=Ferrovibrio sp. TaxID=1917215 RepID=UPI0035B49707
MHSLATQTVDAILQRLRVLQPELKRRYPIRSLGVFGSYVRGEQRPDSDLDILIEPGDGMTLVDFVGLRDELSDALGLTVELANKRSLKPRIRKRILAEVCTV